MHERGEDVRDARARALDGEPVEVAGLRVAAEEFVDEMRPHEGLGVRQHAHRQRVVVAEHAVDPLADEPVGVAAQVLAGPRDAAFEQPAAGRVGAGGEELLQPPVRAALLRQAAEVGGDGDGARLAERELAEPHGRLARREREPVRVAAPGVEPGVLAAVLRERDEPVLQLERTQLRAAAFFGRVHGVVACGRAAVARARRGPVCSRAAPRSSRRWGAVAPPEPRGRPGSGATRVGVA